MKHTILLATTLMLASLIALHAAERPTTIACFWWGPGWPKNCTISNNAFTAIGSSIGYKNMEKMSVNGNTVEGNRYQGNMEPCPVDLSPVSGESIGQAERGNAL